MAPIRAPRPLQRTYIFVHPLITVLSCALFFLCEVKPAYSGHGLEAVSHGDTWTMSDTDNIGLQGTLLASPPGSCTGVPNGLAGGCSARAAAALDDWLDGDYMFGTDWSDLEEAAVTATEKALRPLKAPTRVGTSWIPSYCDRPSCGHLLKGDVIYVDENGDGEFNDTWIDFNLNGIRETGEVDRLRGEQFAWGATSTIIDFNNLGDPSNPQMRLKSGTSPPGLARARARVALGDNPECVSVFSKDCHLSTGGVGVVALPFSVPDVLVNPNDNSSTIDNNGFYGICDPDRFSGDLLSIQRQLDNCLWKVGSTPVTAPQNASVTGEGNAIRQNWIDQLVTKYTASNTTDRQGFSQIWRVDYRFEQNDPITGAPVPIDEALYENTWFLYQTDFDPNPSVNPRLNPIFGQPALNSTGQDTYSYAFMMEHESKVRRYGTDFLGNPIGPDPGDDPLDPLLINKTNPTDDPFWGVDAGLLGFDTDFQTNARSGVGQRVGLRFMYLQEVEGLLISCFDCSHDMVTPPDSIRFAFTWKAPSAVIFREHDEIVTLDGATLSIP